MNSGGRTPSQVSTDQQTIAGYFPGKQFFLTTLEPVSTTTDNWTTLTNQSVGTGGANIWAITGATATASGGTITLANSTAAIPAGVLVGDPITITGQTGTATNINGRWVVSAVGPYGAGANSLSFVDAAGTAGTITAGSVTDSPLQLYNELVRGSGQLAWATDFFDVAAAVESSPTSGLWNVCNNAATAFCYTGDGVHENEVGYRAVKNSGVVNAGKIHR